MIEFEIDGPVPPNVLQSLFDGPEHRGPPMPHSMHPHEDEMDRNMEMMLGQLMHGHWPEGLRGPPGFPLREGFGPFGPPRGEMLPFGPRGPPPGVMIEEEVDGPGGTVVMEGPVIEEQRHMPVEAFQELFPGPLAMHGPPGFGPFGAPDPMIMDMMQEMSQHFQQNMLPKIHETTLQRAPVTCQHDLTKHCKSARSQLHCLGQHAEDISPTCRKDVGRSVPFVCAKMINSFCDVLHSGVLPCLEQHMGALNGECKDSVQATRSVIKKANAHKASLVQREVMEKWLKAMRERREKAKAQHGHQSPWSAAHSWESLPAMSCGAAHTDYRGSDLYGIPSVRNVEHCQAACQAHPHCEFFTWGMPGGQFAQMCFLKKAHTHTVNVNLLMSGPRSCEAGQAGQAQSTLSPPSWGFAFHLVMMVLTIAGVLSLAAAVMDPSSGPARKVQKFMRADASPIKKGMELPKTEETA